jgi:hypothetical protein
MHLRNVQAISRRYEKLCIPVSMCSCRRRAEAFLRFNECRAVSSPTEFVRKVLPTGQRFRGPNRVRERLGFGCGREL